MEVKNKMANTLNFNTVKKQYLTVTLPDEKNTLLMVCMPTKSLFEELNSIKSNFNSTDNSDESLDQALSDLYDLVARVMSRNKAGVKITKEALEKCLDFEDIILFFQSYLTFVNSVKSSKN
jgi:uncharacterized UPF0160 family protein